MNTELEEYKKLMSKDSRRRATVMGIFIFIPLISFVYVYIQNANLKEQLRIIQTQAISLNIIARQAQDESLVAKKRMEKAIEDATKAREEAEACQKSKKK